MFENITKFFKKITKKQNIASSSKDTAKERLHLVLMQDRANVSADFLDLMRQEIIDVIKKYIEVDESAIDVRLTNKENEDGTNGAPALYANIPIINIKEEAKKEAENKIIEDTSKATTKNETTLNDSQQEVGKDDKETFGDTSKTFHKNEDTLKESDKAMSIDNKVDIEKKLDSKEDKSSKDQIMEKVQIDEDKKEE